MDQLNEGGFSEILGIGREVARGHANPPFGTGVTTLSRERRTAALPVGVGSAGLAHMVMNFCSPALAAPCGGRWRGFDPISGQMGRPMPGAQSWR